MPLRVNEVRVAIDGDEDVLLAAALKRAGVRRDDVTSLHVVRRSLDRRRREPMFSFIVDLHLADESGTSSSGAVQRFEVPHVDAVATGDEPLEHPPVVVGTGPAGLFAGLHLARAGFRPILIERGDRMNHRVQRIRAINRDRSLDPAPHRHQ